MILLYLLALAMIIGLPALASQGKLYRGLWGAGSLIMGIITWFFGTMPLGPIPGKSTAASEAVNEVIYAIFVLSAGAAVGCLLAALIYRPRKTEVRGAN